jgi:hypothetical protein
MGKKRTVTPDQSQTAIRRIVDASNRVPRGAQALVMAVNHALDDLQVAVDDARLLGVAWGTIEDALGVWRGAATAHLTEPDVEPVVGERCRSQATTSPQRSSTAVVPTGS